MEWTLFCTFYKDSYERAEIDALRDNPDQNKIYETAKSGIGKGTADIYTRMDFECDFNNNEPAVSPENVYLLTVKVDRDEAIQWKK